MVEFYCVITFRCCLCDGLLMSFRFSVVFESVVFVVVRLCVFVLLLCVWCVCV